VLVALASDDGQSQRELSARLGIHRNAMVTVIDNLERRGGGRSAADAALPGWLRESIGQRV
jgi:DNA-binding MarR family transcriptional regulator